MFIERSAARVRLMRTLFVLLGILPCAGLCAWAALRHSSGHREAIERRLEQVLGLPLQIGSAEHVRPDAIRLRGCTLSLPSGGGVLSVPVIEVESAVGEVRIAIDRLDCTPAVARMLVTLAGQWLRQPARFPMDCVVEVGDIAWRPRLSAAVAPPAAVHVECVAANGSRAVRVRLDQVDAPTPDEIRVVAMAPEDGDGQHSDRFEVNGSIERPLPIAMLEALAGLEAGSLPLGDEACVSGEVAAVLDGSGLSGSARARVERIDLAAASMHLPHRVSGEAALLVDRIVWSRNRIDACVCQCSVSRGRVGQRLLDALVTVLGCRPGVAYRSLTRDEVRGFDDVFCTLRIEADGINVAAGPGRAGSLVRTQGLSIIEEPTGFMPLDRLAWLLSPPGAAPVPASRATAWLLGLFPLADSGGAASGRSVRGQAAGGSVPAESSGVQPNQAARPVLRNEF